MRLVLVYTLAPAVVCLFDSVTAVGVALALVFLFFWVGPCLDG